MQVYVEKFENYLIKERDRSKNTVISYKRDLKQFFEFLNSEGIDLLKIDKINQTNIMAYILHLEKSGKNSATVSRNIATLKTFFKYLLNNNIISSDPVYKLRAPKIDKKPPNSVDLSSIELLLEQPDCSADKGIRDKAILELLFATGIKVSELISLTVSDINLNMAYIECRSAKKKRIIPIGKKASKALRSYIETTRSKMLKTPDDNILFVNCNGTRFTRQGLWKIIKSYAKKADIPESITPNILRHSFAMHLVSNGADMESLQVMLGHSDTATTQIYFQAQKNMIKDVYMKAHPRV